MQLSETLQKAENCLRQGQLVSAEELYQSVIKYDAAQADAHYGLGTVLLHQKKFETALQPLRTAVELLPNVPEFLINLASLEKRLGLADDARASLLKAAQCAQGDSYYLLPICKQLMELGEAAQARQYLASAQPKTPELMLWYARAQGASNEWAGALVTLDELLVSAPSNPVIWREHSKAAAFYGNMIQR